MFALALLVLHIVVFGSARNVVRTKQGHMWGTRQDIQDYKGLIKPVYKFLGVPYAEKPIGNLRFKRPQSLKSQRVRIYNATYFRPICLQNNDYYGKSILTAWPGFDHEKDMSEDCLYLNIYTPSITSCKKKYSVIFYIHGGSYVAGTPVRDISPGEYLPTRDVVLVTVQYRLGPFGFFTTGDSEAPGNMGLLDQVEALKWVQRNIEGFCGDKNSVTLLGESAGGSSVSLHYLSPLSEGLFHRGIAVSGVDFSPFAYNPKSVVLKGSNKLAETLECGRKTSEEKMKCLRSLSSSIILNKSASLHHMSPFVDNHFLPDEPEKLRKNGKFHKLPFMSGFVSQEGAHILQSKNFTNYNLHGFKEDLKEFLSRQYHDQYKNSYTSAAYNALVFQYTPWVDVTDSHRIRKKLIDLNTDYFIVAPTHAALTLHSDHGAPTYMFEFAHRSKYHPKPEWMGVVHEDTTAYKFGLPLLSSPRSMLSFDDDEDRNVSDLMTTIYLNFAKFGQPTPTSVYGTQWEMFNSSSKAYLKIKKNPFMTSKYHPIRIAFWNSYFPTLLSKQPLPPSIEGSKTSGVVAFRGSRFVFIIFIGTLGRILGWKG
ncbi:cholinesterase 1-like [Actinia tenebrosa]|uniref:Cholinesterase 1-like n=1 Tax=Actinia tenebrosa TaxID=6105 RepID=A0A6P8HYV8_ACTTE|nr:cholinesterase 1-like [Actinia tenebrosa]